MTGTAIKRGLKLLFSLYIFVIIHWFCLFSILLLYINKKQMRLAGHLDGDNTHQREQHRIQHIICNIFWTKLTSYSICTTAAKLNLKLLCSLKDLWIRSNAEIVAFELIVKTSVAGDIQSSSRQNSGGCRPALRHEIWSLCQSLCLLR